MNNSSRESFIAGVDDRRTTVDAVNDTAISLYGQVQ